MIDQTKSSGPNTKEGVGKKRGKSQNTTTLHCGSTERGGQRIVRGSSTRRVMITVDAASMTHVNAIRNSGGYVKEVTDEKNIKQLCYIGHDGVLVLSICACCYIYGRFHSVS